MSAHGEVLVRENTSAPVAPGKMPRGIPYIVGNEAAERFSYYGMKTILVVFMTKYLMNAGGALEPMSPAEAKTWYHTFVMANYFFPIIGALIADIFWGKYKTILSLSVIYCLGHLSLALFETRFGLSLGLTLIAIGSGGIKPCVSAHVGDQFTKSNESLIDKAFSRFYFAINFGAFFSSLLTPYLLEKHGPSLAFGIPGILMLIATIVFYMGRHQFTAIPAAGWQQYKKDVFSFEGLRAVSGLGVLYLFVAVFWALYDQTGSSWVLQAEKMDRTVDLTLGGVLPFEWLKFEILASQIQAVNPILIMLYIPLFGFVIYPLLNKITKLNALKKMGIGFFITALSFAMVALAESRIQSGANVSVLWQVVAYFILTAAEVMISITCLEFSYTQAPNSMKSFIMGIFLLSVSLGNGITALVNYFIQNPDGTEKLQGADYYWFFAAMMGVTAVLFLFYARKYKIQNYIQDHSHLNPT